MNCSKDQDIKEGNEEKGSEGSEDESTKSRQDDKDGKALGAADEIEGKEDGETIEETQKKLTLGELKSLVKRTLEENPPVKMTKMNIQNVPVKKKKQVRALEKHLWRIKLDQRHALHDPRFKNARNIRKS